MLTPHRLATGLTGLARAAADLALGAVCAGCGGEPGLLCPACRAALSGPARRADPDPVPPGLPGVHAAAPYAGVVRTVLAAHKEHGRLGLAVPLGDALALAVLAALGPSRRPGRVLLVPVPSRPGATRRRGHDPLLRTTRRAAARLRRRDLVVSVVPALVLARPVLDQAGLDRLERRANLQGALAVRRAAGPLLGAGPAVVVDDVVTTGATLAEAVRALRRGGGAVLGTAVVAATARRPPGPA